MQTFVHLCLIFIYRPQTFNRRAISSCETVSCSDLIGWGGLSDGLGNGDGIVDGDGFGNGDGIVDGDGLGNGDGIVDGDGFGNGDGIIDGDGLGNGDGISSSGDDGFSSDDGDGFGEDRNGNDEGGYGNNFDGDAFDGVESLLMEEESIPNDMFEPLYPGAVVTICAAYCAIMTYAITNKLSYSSIENLLKLLHLLCPTSNHLPSSLYKLKKFFQTFTSSYKKRCICAECDRVLKKGESCHGKNGYLIHVPVEKALKTVVESELLKY